MRKTKGKRQKLMDNAFLVYAASISIVICPEYNFISERIGTLAANLLTFSIVAMGGVAVLTITNFIYKKKKI